MRPESHILTKESPKGTMETWSGECSCLFWSMRSRDVAEIDKAHTLHVQAELGPKDDE